MARRRWPDCISRNNTVEGVRGVAIVLGPPYRTWAEEEAALLASFDDNTRAVLLAWRERARPSKAQWRRALRTEPLGRYLPPGTVEAEGECGPELTRYAYLSINGLLPGEVVAKAGRPTPPPLGGPMGPTR